MANTAGIVVSLGPSIDSLSSGTASSNEYAILVRGPMVIQEDYLPAKDCAGTALSTANKTSIATALKALSPPIISHDQDDPSEEGTL